MEKEMEKEEKQRRDLSCKCTVIFSKNGRTLGSKFACWEGKKSNFRSRKGGGPGLRVFERHQGSIYWKIPPPPRGGRRNISQCHLGENMKRGIEKGGKCKRNRRKEIKG